jgi:tryptophan halogenase
MLPGRVQNDADRAEFNRQTDFEFERIRDFLILHYWANGRDEPFWQACRAMTLPDTLAAKIALFKANARIFREHEELFTEVAWAQVLIGQGVDPGGWHPIADQVDPADLKDYLETIAALYAREASRMEPHADHIARTCAAAAIA